MKFAYFKKNPHILKHLFSESLDDLSVRQKLFASGNIEKDETITHVMIEIEKSNKKEKE